MKVGFIGLGSMGLPIARHVLQAGHTVVVYNRTRSRADALKPLRPTVADTPAAAARGWMCSSRWWPTTRRSKR